MWADNKCIFILSGHTIGVNVEISCILEYLYSALVNEIQQSINTHARINKFILLYPYLLAVTPLGENYITNQKI